MVIIRCCGLVRLRMTVGYLEAQMSCQYYAMFFSPRVLVDPFQLAHNRYYNAASEYLFATAAVDDADANQKDFSFIFSTCAVFCFALAKHVRPQIRHCSALLKRGAIAKVAEEVFWFSHSMTSSGTGLSLARRRESN